MNAKDIIFVFIANNVYLLIFQYLIRLVLHILYGMECDTIGFA